MIDRIYHFLHLSHILYTQISGNFQKNYWLLQKKKEKTFQLSNELLKSSQAYGKISVKCIKLNSSKSHIQKIYLPITGLLIYFDFYQNWK